MLILEEYNNVINNNYIFIDYDPEGYNEDFEDEYGIDEYEAADIAEKIAKNGGINILSDKELRGLLIDKNNNQIIGGLWINNDMNDFSFDIAIKKEYQNKGLSKILIDNALEYYKMYNEMYSEVNHGDLPMRVDVVNPKLVNILQQKYNFKIIDKYPPNHIIMSI